MESISPTKFICAYCGSRQSWTGTGTPVCSQCGATQPARPAAVSPAPPKRRGWIFVLLFAVVALIAAGGYFQLHRKPAAVAPVTGLKGADLSPPSVGSSRIVRVDNPKVRTVPKGAEFTADDLLRSADQPPAPPFDTLLLVLKTPHRMTDEEDNQIYLGEVTNSSPNQVAIAPVALLRLRKNGQVIDSAEHNFPDLLPGQHVPLFFRYDADPRTFDTFDLSWKPTQSYALADDRHPLLSATVTGHTVQRGSSVVNFTREYRYNYAKVTGTIENQGHARAKNVRLFVIARDAKGEITGYERQDVSNPLPPGGSYKFDVAVTQWGGPIVGIEAVALPTSPPPLQ